MKVCRCNFAIKTLAGSPPQHTGGTTAEGVDHHISPLAFGFDLVPVPLPSPRRHHFFQRVLGHPSAPSSPHPLLYAGGEGVTGVEHERVPLSLATAAGSGPQVPTQGVPGGALLHDPLQHLFDSAGHLHAGLCCAAVPQQLYVGSNHCHLMCTLFQMCTCDFCH